MMIERGNWLIEFYCEWPAVLMPSRYNWTTFTVIHLEIENERNMGGFEIKAMLLGFGIRWRWNYNPEAETLKEVMRRVAEIKEQETP